MKPDLTDHTGYYLEHRRDLLSAAYRVLGSRVDAEDAVQEVWLRWADVDLSDIRSPKAYLLTMTTRAALNRARSQQRRREEYVGPWLPEPWAMRDSPSVPAGMDPEAEAELAESVSMAMLVVLASLSPLERAVFVLREVFALPYDEIASSLERTSTSVRQVAHRARSHVHARRPRGEVADSEHLRATNAFEEAVRGGSLEALMSTLAPEVVLTSDGGGHVSAAIRPVVGHERVARFLLGLATVYGNRAVTRAVTVNGRASIAIDVDGHFDALMMLDVADGTVGNVFILRNPEKLGRIGTDS